MGKKTEEDIIRDFSNQALADLIQNGTHNYSIDAISIAKDELKNRENNPEEYQDTPDSDTHSFFGCGTMLYGKREVESDGSYIATKWMTVLFFPIGAIDSYRVKVLDMGLGTVTYDMKKVKKNWRQILNTLLVAWVPTIVMFLYLNIKR